jgi:hypothetical protein
MRRLVVLVVAGALAFGCGKDSEPNPAVAKCESFATTWCDQAMHCLVEVGSITSADFQANFDSCADVAKAAARCKNAMAVTSSYDACIAGIKAMPCSSWNVPQSQISQVTPPADCTGVIEVSQ